MTFNLVVQEMIRDQAMEMLQREYGIAGLLLLQHDWIEGYFIGPEKPWVAHWRRLPSLIRYHYRLVRVRLTDTWDVLRGNKYARSYDDNDY